MPGEPSLSCGIELTSAVWDLAERLKNAQKARYAFVCVPLIHYSYKREFISGVALERTLSEPFTRPDMVLPNSDWSNLVVGSLISYENVDCIVPHVQRNAEAALLQEISLASHLNIPAVTFKLTTGLDKKINLARIIYSKMSTISCLQFWVQVPMTNPAKQAMTYRSTDEHDFECPWNWWNDFRGVCDFDKKLGVALIVSKDLPDEREIQRWLGEPIKALILPVNLFLTNKRGYPVLSKAHQELVHKFCSLNIQFIITGADGTENIGYYYTYLDQHWKRGISEIGPRERFGRGYEDYLQFPLQPLMDNLESGTYEVFEKDPVKYTKYQSAIGEALKAKYAEMKANQTKLWTPIVVTVVGAGRGPLVRAALNAGKITNINMKVYAVEKNPNAVLTLQALKKDVFEDRVTIVSCDMRDWKAPEKADIMVSELLGSFGDNELSPECLDGAQKYLKDDGISIPQSYTSYIAPVQSSKLYNELRMCQEKDKGPLAHFETPYVVYLQNKYDIDEPQALFTFHHPNRDEVINNCRYESKTFSVSQKAILHGFSGYFDVKLFDNITLSIMPKTHSEGMFSWFPIFFPLKEPVNVEEGDTIQVHFWRRCSPKNVWYEWALSKPKPLAIHNPNGRSYNMGL